MSQKVLRLGTGAGFSSDRLDPALDLVLRGELDFIVFECVGDRPESTFQPRVVTRLFVIQSVAMTKRQCTFANALEHDEVQVAAHDQIQSGVETVRGKSSPRAQTQNLLTHGLAPRELRFAFGEECCDAFFAVVRAHHRSDQPRLHFHLCFEVRRESFRQHLLDCTVGTRRAAG